jgi:3-methylfumaryl-CoA hydratase
MKEAIDIDHLRSWIGREETAIDVVTANIVGKFQATFDREPDDLQPGSVAPRLLHFCLGQPAALTRLLAEDGHPQRGSFLPPVPLPRRMWAGGSLSFHDDLRIGDTMRRVSRIEDVVLKEGRTGLLCFVTVKHEIERHGQPILSETQDVVYRGPDTGEQKKPSLPAPVAADRRQVDPWPPFLFRYSALTFNSHRIHYDYPYATKTEGYPGLVVHGPLQATLLLNLATEMRGASPAHFTFRSLSPLFDNEAFYLNAEEEAGGLRLWTARSGGSLAMTAQAEWS